jgi:GxxExxY protein
MKVQKEVPMTFLYEGHEIQKGYRIDLLIDEKVVVETKAIESIQRVQRGQLLSYLKLGGYKLGYVLNFNVAHMRDGITRMVNGL